MSRRQDHLSVILAAADAFGPLIEQVVFVGGAVAGLLITDPGAPDVRPTDDIDVVVEVSSYGGYNKIQEQLRKLGFEHDNDGPQCRFKVNGITIDVMPADEKILKFSNRFYPAVMESATRLTLDGRTIRLITAPLFVCTKLEAFGDRGKGDYQASSDMEDVIAIVNGRKELVAECAKCDIEIREYLSRECQKLVKKDKFLEAITSHLPPDSASQDREEIVLGRLKELAALV